MATTELLLIRHGESEGNVAATTAARDGLEVVPVTARDADVPLSATGVEQGKALGTWLRGSGAHLWPDRVWSSPYLRAQQTAQLAFGIPGGGDHDGDSVDLVRADASAWRPLLDERVRDRELGILDTLTKRGIEARFPGEAARRRWLGKFYYRPPGGESWADLALRLRSFLADLDRADSPNRVAVVCHDAVVLAFRYACEGMTETDVLAIGRDTPVLNTGTTLLVREPVSHSWEPRVFNSVRHLDEQGAPKTEHGGDRDGFSR